MKKPISLRDYLVQNIQFLKDNPDKLSILVESGRYRSTLATGYSMESICPVRFLIQDFSGDPDLIAFLLFQWLRVHQSELMANLEKIKMRSSLKPRSWITIKSMYCSKLN
ncbi:phage tail protein [Acinetobacter sp. UGAL515B_02]|nr:phage tail protein [Acinetobacter sp. UGAL515B_02]